MMSSPSDGEVIGRSPGEPEVFLARHQERRV